jgi:hypothetical protein
MGMVYWIIGITPAQVDLLLKTPDLASDLAAVAPLMSSEERLSRVSSPRMRQFFDEYQSAKERLEPLSTLEQAFSLDKSWHLIMYTIFKMIDSTEEPALGLFVGDPIGRDLGYGPPLLQTPEHAREFSEFFARFDVNTLKKQVSYQDMLSSNIYGVPFGSVSEAEAEKDIRDSIDVFYTEFSDYLKRMAEKGDGLLSWLS